MTGQNGDILTLSATSSCRAGMYNATVTVALSENMLNFIESVFKVNVILVQPPALHNKLYIIETHVNSHPITPFVVETGTSETSIP